MNRSHVSLLMFLSVIAAWFGTGTELLAQEPGAEALIAAFGFSEGSGSTTADASGNSMTGMITGAVWSGAGRYGNAISFDGSGDFVTISNTAPLNLTTGMTLQAWVYPVAVSDWRTVMLKQRSGGLSYALYSHDNATGPAAFVRVGGADVPVPGGGALPLNTWTHVAATYNNAQLSFYTNGVLAGTQSVSGDISTDSNPLCIGGNTVWGEYFSGLIDEVRVHSRALTEAEIQSLMALPVDPGPGFEFIIYNNPVAIGLSDSGLFNLGIAPVGDFTSWVFPMLSGLPPDTTAAFEPPNGPAHPGPFALTINTGPATPGGTFLLTLTGTNGALSATTNLTLIVNTNPGFRVSVEPSALIIAQGQAGLAVYDIVSENGYSQSVTLQSAGLPAGASVSFQPSSLIPSGAGSVQFNVGASTPPGTYPIQLLATDGVLTNEALFNLTVQVSSGEGSWRQLSIGDSGAFYYGVIVGDVGGTGTNRVFGSAGDGVMYEYVYDGTNWSFAQMPVGVFADGQMHNMEIGPGRGDGTNRLYIAAAGSGRIYEMSWADGSWTTNVVATLSGVSDIIIGNGRNDGVTRMYASWLAGATEFTWDGAGWTSVTMNSSEGGFVHGIDLNDGRNDGTNRIYTANQGNGEVYEYTWNGSSWAKLFIADTVDARNIEVGPGRNDGTNRVFVPAGGGNVYEFTWNGSAWQQLSMGDGGTANVKVQSVPAVIRSDGFVRVYAASDSGVFEYNWNGSWNAQLLGNATAYMYGLAVGDGLNNGTTQVYGSSYDGNVFLFEWVPAAETVPDVVGLSQSAAMSAITNAGFTVGLVSTAVSDSAAWGLVITQEPPAGAEIAPGSVVNITVSIGPAPEIQLAPVNEQLLLMWPTSSIGFTLWFTTNLAAPVWSSVSPPPVVVDDQFVVTNQPAGPAGFYQLQRQQGGN